MNEQELRALQQKATNEIIMFRWLRHNPNFSPVDANYALMDSWMTENGLSFTETNLDVAAAALEGQLAKQHPGAQAPQPPAQSTETPSDDLDVLFPLPANWKKVYTAKDVHDLSGSEYKLMYHSAKGSTFRARVDEIMRRENVRTNQHGGRI